MRKLIIATAVSISVVSSSVPVIAKDKTPQMTPLQIQSLQTHDFEAKKEDVFAAVVSVLQDAGYRIQSGDLATGLITAVGSTKSKTSYNLFWGFGKSKKTPIVTAFIEQIGSITRVRLNFVMAKVKSTVYGSQPSDEEPVLDAAVYTDAFEKIEQNLFVRQGMVDTGKPTPAPAVAPTPAAAPTPAPKSN